MLGFRAALAQVERGRPFGNYSFSAINSLTVNVQYYLSDEDFRPFVGLGIGLFNIYSSAETDNGITSVIVEGFDPERRLGFYPRVGFDAGHVNLIIDYNIIGRSVLTARYNINQPATITVKHGYISLKVGISIGGGRR